jgi:muconolactone delta-isomerase
VSGRTFIVRVTDSPPRVVVEDVRAQRQAVASDLDAVGHQIAIWLGGADGDPTDCDADAHGRKRSP